MMAERVFLVVSSAELFMGVLGICNVILPMSRFILWGFLAVYAAIALMGHYSRREKLLYGVLLLFGVMLYINSGLNAGIKAPIYLCALKNVDVRKYCKVSFTVLVVAFVSIASASIFAGFGNIYMMDERADRGFHGLRYCFGFPHANITMAVIFAIMLLLLHLFSQEIKWYGYLILGAVYIGLCYLTDCRTAFCLGILILMLSICVRYVKWDGWNTAVFVLFLFTFFGMLLISLLAAFHYESAWMAKIDYAISGRMSQLAKYPGNVNCALPYVENWHLFGSRLNRGGYDLGYVQIFYYYGIIPAMCYLSFVIYAAVCAWKNKRTVQLVLLSGFCMYLFMENIYFSNFIPVNFLLIYSAVIVREQGIQYPTQWGQTRAPG